MLPQIASLVHPPFYDTYLKYIESEDLFAELSRSGKACADLLGNLSESQWDFAYAQGKWTVKQVVLHLVDCELIFNYRALRIGRDQEFQILRGFDENLYADSAKVSLLSGRELLSLFESTRRSTQFLVKTFDKEQLMRTGECNSSLFEAKALLFINAGHALHHLSVIRERYLH